MGSSEIDKENIITATMEELTEEEHQGLPSCGGARQGSILEGLEEGSWWPCQEGGGVRTAVSQAYQR